ncbi:hypothetical protein Cgig2_008537 [Carnegiea gigantea]|uniref:Uncharacterized protein n=1 Tax=Carnegiea gigantea TaxID=171969 RepID=A0A9Q1Q8G1_9CARY|nr:hypothetical protein Cgig2_008537 [Carnegiea gigantea]
MAFPCFLDTKAMGEFITRHFSWDRRGVAFPPLPLPKDFQTLCPGFELALAEQAVEHYELPELPQVFFCTMLLNEVERLGVLHGQRLRLLEAALNELRWSTFESWLWLFSDRICEAWFCPKSGSGENAGADCQEGSSGRGAADEVSLDSSPINISLFSHMGCSSVSLLQSGSKCRARSECFYLLCKHDIPCHSQHERDVQLCKRNLHLALEERFASAFPLPEDFHVLCPCFSLAEAEGAATEFELPKLFQATFYAMLLNEVFELGVTHDYMAESMKSSLVGLRWSNFEVWLDCMDEVIRGAQLYRPLDEVEVQGAQDGQGEGSGSANRSDPSSDEE